MYPPHICSTCLRKIMLLFPLQPHHTEQSVKWVSVPLTHFFFLSWQYLQTICSSQESKGVRMQEGILRNTAKQHNPFTNTNYRKSGSFSILLPAILYQVVLHPWTVDSHQRFWKCWSLQCQEALQMLGFMTVEPFIYVPMFGFVCVAQIWTI